MCHAGTASTLRLTASVKITWTLRPFSFLFFRPRWGPAGFSSLRPRVSSLNSEHPSPECIMLEQRAPFAGMYHAGTASTLRLTASVKITWTLRLFSFFFSPPLGPCWFLEPSAESLVAEQRAPFAGMYHARTASTLRLNVSCWNSEHPSPDCLREKHLDPSVFFLFFFAPAGALLVFRAFGRESRR